MKTKVQKTEYMKNGFTPTPTLALLQSVFNKIKYSFINIEKRRSIVATGYCNKNTTPKLVSGFTLVEALVAISILMVAVVGPLTIAQKGLSASIYSKDQMIASYLAQDAIEFVINKRDSNVVKSMNGETVSWLDGLDSCVQIDGLTSNISKVCSVDTIDGAIGLAGTSDLYIHKSGDVFVYYTHNPTSNDKSKFRREVNIRRDVAEDEALITVKVYWDGTNPNENSVTVKTYIYNLGEGGTPPKL